MPEGIGYEGYDEINRTLEDQEAVAAKRRLESEQREQDRRLIEKWAEKVSRARKHDKGYRERWAEDRRMARGETEWLVDTNLIGSILEVLAAFLYAKNPDVSIRPSESVNKKFIEAYRGVGDTLQIMVSRLFHDAGLKKTAKRWVRKTMTVGTQWIKAGIQTRKGDPITEKSINDLQENLKRIESKAAQLADGEKDNSDAEKAEIRANITALEGRMERQRAEGLVLDLMAPEDVVVAPDCGEVENYLQAPWIAFDNYKDRDAALEITGWKGKDAELLKQANLYTQRPRRGEDDEGGSQLSTQWVSLDAMDSEDTERAENPDGFYRFTEIWSLRDGVVFTMIEGVQKKWAREPYAPRTGARFYPCFGLMFHPIDGERYAQSDVYQLTRLQNEYGRTRSNKAEHRRRAIPGIVFDETQVTEESVNKLTSAQVQEYTGVKPVRPGVDMRTLFAPKVYNRIDEGLYDTDEILKEMEKISGAQEAAQGGVQVEKTATEAKIQESGRGARSGARLDDLEDALTELAEYVTQITLQVMDQDDAERYAGPEAVWVDMTVDQALSLFAIEIKAGSTGKPKALSDRETWGTLMPLIEGMIDRVGAARQQGQEWAAKPWIALLDETSKRLDDRLEVEKFLPVVPEEVLQANAQGSKPTEKEEAETRLDDARTLKEAATAVEKVPELFARPALDIVGEIGGPEEPEPGPVDPGLPPAPSPLPTGIN